MEKCDNELCVSDAKAPLRHEVVWVIVNRLTKLAHLILLRVVCLLVKLAQLYVHDKAC